MTRLVIILGVFLFAIGLDSGGEGGTLIGGCILLSESAFVVGNDMWRDEPRNPEEVAW